MRKKGSGQGDGEAGEGALVGAGQTVGGERVGRRRGFGGEQVPGDEDEERHGGAVIPAR